MNQELLNQIKKSALEFSSRTSFRNGNYPDYRRALRNGLIDDVCSHMQKAHKDHTDDSLGNAALLCKTRSEFQNSHKAEYLAARRRGRDFLDLICLHMVKVLKSHTADSLRECASRFNMRHHFGLECPAEEQAARKRGKDFMDLICAHMDTKEWSKDDVLKLACSFNSRSKFEIAFPGPYENARRNGYLDKACSHMIRQPGGFNMELTASLYFYEFTGPNSEKVWKVGITNRTASNRRNRLGISGGWSAAILGEIYFEKGSEAYRIEQSILSRFRLSAYEDGHYGPRFLKNGHTELFRINVYEEYLKSQSCA